LIGQGIQQLFMTLADMPEKKAGTATVAVLILLSVILTSLGVYDKIAQWAGAGSAVLVTGFANSMASAAIEHRSEGVVLGVGGKMFKLAGPVIVFGTVAAFLIALLHFLLNPGMGGRILRCSRDTKVGFLKIVRSSSPLGRWWGLLKFGRRL
jgi:stage V sporulation protein AC